MAASSPAHFGQGRLPKPRAWVAGAVVVRVCAHVRSSVGCSQSPPSDLDGWTEGMVASCLGLSR